VEPWKPKNWSFSYFEVERIRLFQEWWIAYYDYGSKAQMTIKAGAILVKLRQDEEAVLQNSLQAEKQAKQSARANAAKAKTEKKIQEAVKKETKRLAEENCRIQLEKDQLVNKLRGGRGGDGHEDDGDGTIDITTNTSNSASSRGRSTSSSSNVKMNSATKPTASEDKHYNALATEISGLKDIVTSMLNATTGSVQVSNLPFLFFLSPVPCPLSPVPFPLSLITLSLHSYYLLFHRQRQLPNLPTVTARRRKKKIRQQRQRSLQL